MGDRHLDNFLLDTTDGQILGIDFGIAFGNGIQLAVPELIPFRLTRQIEGVLAPMGVRGLFSLTMVHAIRGMQGKRDLILDASHVFVTDPLFDWVKSAKSKNTTSISLQSGQTGNINMGESIAHASGSGSTPQQPIISTSWYPKKKLGKMKEKLLCRNPVLIMLDELTDTRHNRMKYIPQLRASVRGDIHSDRYQGAFIGGDNYAEYLPPQRMVNLLLDIAMDPDLLGRTWIGWAPQI